MKFFKNKLAVTIIVLSVTFLILVSHSIKGDNISFMRNGIGVTFGSIQGSIFRINSKIKDGVSFLFNFSNVKKENEELTKKNNELENKLVEYNSLKKENETLRETLNFRDQKLNYNIIGCDIIQKSGNGLLDQFVINKGTKDGVGKRMVVITAQGLVGQVTSAASNWAIVQTISNENLAVNGEIERTNDNSGMVKGYKDGTNKLLAKLSYLPLNSTVQKGDVILTSGLDALYPKGIRIGTVIDVEEDKGKVMKNAIINPYVDFNKLQEVFVVIPKEKVDVKLNDVKY